MESFDTRLRKYLTNDLSSKEMEAFGKEIRSGLQDEILKDQVTGTPLDSIPESISPPEEDDQIVKAILGGGKQRFFPMRIILQVAASIVLLVLALAWVNADRPDLATEKKTTQKETAQKIIRLPDGSTVILNAGSRLHYDTAFGNSRREVTLSGEAYFMVTPDPKRPFIVHSGDVSIKVLGTAFNVNPDPETSQIFVTVTHGIVDVSHGAQAFGKIRKDEKMVVDLPSGEAHLSPAKADEAIAWIKEFLILDNIPLSQAAELISSRYNVRVVLNPILNDCTIQGVFYGTESLEHVLKSISIVLHMKYEVKDNIVSIEGTVCH